MSLTLEIVEGPGAGQAVQVDRALVIGRDPDVDLPLDDSQASRRHARLSPTANGAVVEDLGSTNGTLINRNEVHGRAAVATGDELVIGVTVMQLRSAQDVARQASAVRAVPPGLAAPARRPTYVDASGGEGGADSGVPELERLRDRRTKAKATIAPLAIFVLAALAVIIYLGIR